MDVILLVVRYQPLISVCTRGYIRRIAGNERYLRLYVYGSVQADIRRFRRLISMGYLLRGTKLDTGVFLV